MKYKIVDERKTEDVKRLILAVLGAPRYKATGINDFLELYPQIPKQLIIKAAEELIAEKKIEKA